MEKVLIDIMKQGAREISEHFEEADADWQPVMFAQLPDREIQIVGFDPSFLYSDASKDLMSDLIAAYILKERLEAVGLILSAWVLEGEEAKESQDKQIPPRDHPKRKEQLLISATDADGIEYFHAPIIRDGKKPPRLGAWITEERASYMTGRFVEPIINALKEVRASGSRQDNQSRSAGRDADGGD